MVPVVVRFGIRYTAVIFWTLSSYQGNLRDYRLKYYVRSSFFVSSIHFVVLCSAAFLLVHESNVPHSAIHLYYTIDNDSLHIFYLWP